MIIDKHNRLFEGTFEALITQSTHDLMLMPTRIIKNILGWSFEPGYDHPFTQGLLDYVLEPERHPTRTRMHSFYQTYTPKNLLEAFFNSTDDPLLKGVNASALAILTSTTSKTLITPWANESIPMGGFAEGMPETEGSHFLGPVSERHLLSEYQRLVEIYTSVKAHGFDVDKQTDTIRGYFLKYYDEYRFIVVGGNHRVGVLNALGSNHVPIQIHPQRIPIVSLEDLNNWPQVKNGVFDPHLARAMFLAFFEKPRTLKEWTF